MELYVETRDYVRDRDYRFLGAAPATTWWREYGRLTQFEQPTCIVENSGVPRFYLSGLRSARRDSSGAGIRYTIVGDAKSGSQEDAATMCGLVEAWLDDVTGTGAALSAPLDELFTEEFVRSAYDSGGPDVQDEVTRRIVLVAGSLPTTVLAPVRIDVEAFWYGDLDDDAARRAFLSRCRAVAAGERSLACVLNTAGIEEIKALAASHEDAVVLAPGGPERALAFARPTLDEGGEADAPPGKVSRQSLRPLPRALAPKVRTIGLTVLVLFLSFLLILLVRR